MQIKQSQNILNWYPFKKEDSILMIGSGLENVVKVLESKCSKLKVIESDIEKFEENFLYDYIILIGVNSNTELKLAQLIKGLEKNIKQTGKFLIAVDNKFGLRFFAGNPENILQKKFASLVGYKNEEEKIETFTKSRLERKLKEIGYNTNFYYPLPDYRLPNVIFSDRQLPKYTSIGKYHPYYTEKSDIIMDEVEVFREILKNDRNMFTFFANSFLIEASKEESINEFKYISFNNLRKPQYQLITKIADGYVEKQPIENQSEHHYEEIKNNIEILKEKGFETLDYIEDGKIKSKYIKQKYMLNNILLQKLEKENLNEFYSILNKYIEIISKNSYQEKDYKETVFAKYNVEAEDDSIIEKLHFLKDGFWDMTFKNCFYVDNKFLFFDQEWRDENLPYEFILYRSILYTVSLRRYININDLYEKYNLTQFKELFEKLDNKLQESIRDEEEWKFYTENHWFDIDSTKQEIINLNTRSEAQIGAIKNLEAENKELRQQLENTFMRKVKRNVKKIVGGNNDKEN